MKEDIEIPKAKKCDYCDDFAKFKINVDGLYNYLCTYCYKNTHKVKREI